MSWIRLRRLGYFQFPELLCKVSWSLWARNLNPSRRHCEICSTAIWSRDFRQKNTIMRTTCIVASYTRHDTLVRTNIFITSTKIIISESDCITIGHLCLSGQFTQWLVQTMTLIADNSEHLVYVCSHFKIQRMPCLSSEDEHEYMQLLII